MRKVRRITVPISAAVGMVLASCGDGPAASTQHPPTRDFGKALDRQSEAARPTTMRDGTGDATWWGLDLRRTPVERARRLLNQDGSHVDQSGIGVGRLPPPPGDVSDIELRAFGRCWPAFYVRFGGRRTLLCNRDQPTTTAAEGEFVRLASAIMQRFDVRPGIVPATRQDGMRAFALRFADRPGTRRVYSPILYEVILSRNGTRILLVVSLKNDPPRNQHTEKTT